MMSIEWVGSDTDGASLGTKTYRGLLVAGAASYAKSLFPDIVRRNPAVTGFRITDEAGAELLRWHSSAEAPYGAYDRQASRPMLFPEWSPGFHPTAHEAERRKLFVNLKSDDVQRIVAVRNFVAARADRYVTAFFDYLSGLTEVAALFRDPKILEEAMRMKREHLVAMVQGDYNASYIWQRLQLGDTYRKAGLDVRVFLGAYHYLMTAIGRDITAHLSGDPMAAFETFVSLKKVAFLDIAIIIDAIISKDGPKLDSMEQWRQGSGAP